MKKNKLRFLGFTLGIFLFMLTNTYAQGDVSDILFSPEQDAKVETSDIIFSFEKEDALSQAKSLPSSAIKTTSQKEIDQMVERALEEARKKQEAIEKREKILQEKVLQDAKEAKKTEESVIVSSTKPSSSAMVAYAKSLLGTRYSYGGTSPLGMDCSAYVQAVYTKFNVKLPRTTFEQVKVGKKVDLSNIQENDLLFFDTRAKKYLLKNTSRPNAHSFLDIQINEKDSGKKEEILYPSQATHVGIYIGAGEFLHASSSKGKVVVEKVESPYFKDRLLQVNRYF